MNKKIETRGRKPDIKLQQSVLYDRETKEKTFQEIGDYYGFSRQRAHQIYQKAKTEVDKRTAGTI